MTTTNTIGEARQSLADRLEQAGVPVGVTVTTDPLTMPPMILIAEADGLAAVGIGAWSCVIPVKCVVMPPGDRLAVDLLEQMLIAVLGVAFAPWTWGTYRPSTDVSMPMVELTYPCTIPNPHC